MGNCYCCSDSPESDDYTQFDTSEEYSSSVTSRNINNRHRRDGGNNGSRGRSRQSSQARAPQGTSSHNTNRIMVVPDVSAEQFFVKETQLIREYYNIFLCCATALVLFSPIDLFSK